MKNILLIEDDLQLSKSIQEFLKTEGYSVVPVYDGEMGERAFIQENYNLVLLDLGLPKVNGIDLCKKFRETNSGIPVIILTAFGDIDTKMIAFETGADDYIVKPFHLQELGAKIKVFLKRQDQSPVHEKTIELGDLTIDTSQKKVFRQSKEIDLTPKEFNLLEFLVRNRKRVVSKDELALNLWQGDYGVSHNTIEVYISFLRNKIDKKFKHKFIRTKPGFGYYIETEE